MKLCVQLQLRRLSVNSYVFVVHSIIWFNGLNSTSLLDRCAAKSGFNCDRGNVIRFHRDHG